MCPYIYKNKKKSYWLETLTCRHVRISLPAPNRHGTMSNMQPGFRDKSSTVKCQTGQVMVDHGLFKHQTGVCVLHFHSEILRVHMCVRQRDSVCPESSSGEVWQKLWLFPYDQRRLSLTPAVINSDRSYCSLYFIVFSFSPHPLPQVMLLKRNHAISNILKVAGILHHHWTIFRGCLWEKNYSAKHQLALSINRLQNWAS